MSTLTDDSEILIDSIDYERQCRRGWICRSCQLKDQEIQKLLVDRETTEAIVRRLQDEVEELREMLASAARQLNDAIRQLGLAEEARFERYLHYVKK
mgnify:CR=1 FL=1